MPIPLICCSADIVGDVAMRAKVGVSGITIDLQVGRRWTDPVYSTNEVVTDSKCLLGLIAYLLTSDSGNADTFTKSYQTTSVTKIYKPRITSSGTFQWDNGNTVFANDLGRAIAKRLGITPNMLYPYSGAAANVDGGVCKGIWTPGQGLYAGIDDDQGGQGGVRVMHDGGVFTYSFGSPLYDNILSFEGLPQRYAKRRNNFADVNLVSTEFDYSFETLVWPYISQGEVFRFYSDRDAATTYLTAAMTDIAEVASLKTTTGLTTLNSPFWIDGELVLPVAVASNDITVERFEPKAHSIGAPVSRAFVATYALADSGGNCSIRGGFRPKRHDYNVDLHDLDIAVLKVTE